MIKPGARDEEHPGIAVLREILKNLWCKEQGGIPSYSTTNGWAFISTALPQTTPEQLDSLFALVGLTPEEISVKGECSNCLHSKNGRERGWNPPCVKCLRPSHDLWEPKPL